MRVRLFIFSSLLLMALLPPASASAYPQDPNNCNDSTITYYFTSSWTGYPSQRTWAREAIELWEQPLDFTGSRHMAMTSLAWGVTGGTNDVGISLEDMVPSKYGVASCSWPVPYVDINRDYVSSERFIRQVTRHELGHLAGFEHSGGNDSWNGDDPATMATCMDYSAFPLQNRIAQDDAAYANWSHSNLDYRQMQANFGFEQGLSYWGVQGGSAEWLSSGGATGPGHIRFKTEDASQYIYQTVNIATGDDDEEYRAVINFRHNAPLSGGSIRGTLYRKQIAYDDRDTPCAYADGLTDQDLNSWTYVSSGFVALASTGWLDPTVPEWTRGASDWVNPQNSEGYVFQFRLNAFSQNDDSVPQWIYLDNLRGEGT